MNRIVSSFTNNFNTNISGFFSKNNTLLRCYAAYTGFIKRERILTASDLISMLAISSFSSKAKSLLEMTSILRSINPKVSITPQSLQGRINSDECVAFLKIVLANVFHRNILNVLQHQYELFKPFKRILIEDSSKWELSDYLESTFKGFGGNGSKSYLKINVIYDLFSGRFVHLSEHSGCKSDQTIGRESLEFFQAGDFILRDLGYLQMKGLEKIQEIGAHYLSRISGSTTIRLEKKSDPVQFGKLFDKKSINGKLDIYVYVGTEKHYTRLVAFRAPQGVAEKRRRNLNKTSVQKGHKTTAENMSRQDFTIYITNVGTDIWPMEIIATIYRLRWQIELIFKSFKSQLKIEYMPGKNKNRILTLLYSKWLAIIICTNFYELGMYYLNKYTDKEASFHKVINWFLTNENFRRVILIGVTIKFVKTFILDLDSGWSKDKRIKRKSSREMIKNKTPSYVEGFVI